MRISPDESTFRSTERHTPAPAPLWLLLALSAAAALAYYAAFPPIAFWPAILLVPPLILLVPIIARSARTAAIASFIPFALAYAAWHFWIWDNQVSRLGFPIIPLYLAVYPAAFAGVLVLVRKRLGTLAALAIAPALWIALEALRGEIIFTGYPWYLLGVPLIDAPIVFRGGPYDTGFLLLTAVAIGLPILPPVRARLLTDLDRPRAWFAAIPTLIALPIALATLIAGWFPERLPDAAKQGLIPRAVVAGVVQTNVPQSNRSDWTIEQRIKDFNRFAQLTFALADGPPDHPPTDFIVWPETMYPGFFGLTPEAVATLNDAGIAAADFPNAMLHLSEAVDIPLVIGAVVHENFRPIDIPPPDDDPSRTLRWFETDRRFNSAFLLRDGEVIQGQRYDKIDLTPFGEAIPHADAIPWLKRRLTALGPETMPFDLESAPIARRIAVPTPTAGPVVLATPICFESTLARSVRRLAIDEQGRLGIDLIINMTNDGWFGEFPGGQGTALLHARWRAAEFRTPMLRAANTGISAWIDPDGRVVQRGPTHAVDPATGEITPWPAGAPVTNRDGILTAEIPIRPIAADGTPIRPEPAAIAFPARGNLPAALCVLATAFTLFWLMLPPRQSRIP
ncbi:MAG: apolipoprotein N-acyltransferase [Phycisphaerales bacterium]